MASLRTARPYGSQRRAGQSDADGGGAQTRRLRPVAGHAARKGIGWGPRLEIALLIGPALLVFVAFVIFPVVLAAYYGFFSWKGYGPADRLRRPSQLRHSSSGHRFHEALGHNAVHRRAVARPPGADRASCSPCC